MKTAYGPALVVLACATVLLNFGCASQPAERSNLTAGQAKLHLQKGQTTQAEVLEVFGPPDLVTHRDDMQVWTYDKMRYDVQSGGGFLLGGVAYGSGAGLGGIAGSRQQSSSTATMLIIYFDQRDIVQEYRLSVTRF
jgi:hypothetical protein